MKIFVFSPIRTEYEYDITTLKNSPKELLGDDNFNLIVFNYESYGGTVENFKLEFLPNPFTSFNVRIFSMYISVHMYGAKHLISVPDQLAMQTFVLREG